MPPAGVGICDVCHRAPNPGWDRCYSCAQAIAQVSRPIELVVPISLTLTDGQFYHLLKGYKGNYATASQPAQLASLYIRFLKKHGSCISQAAGHEWDTITIVPSSSGRAGPHPLEQVATWTATILGHQYASLLTKGPGAIGHNKADDQGYQTTGKVSGRSVLLIDDTFTSGARVQSAASALQLGGAHVVATVVAGRIITLGWSQESQASWDEAGKTPFSFETCCLE